MEYIHMVFPLALLGVAILFQIHLHDKDERFSRVHNMRKKR